MGGVKCYAVIIGVSEYKDQNQLPTLPCAKNDAIRVAQDLYKYGQFGKDQICLLVNADKDTEELNCQYPTRGDILQCIQHVADSASNDDLILVFFAGHGVEISENPYLIAADTRMDVLAETAVNVKWINETLEKSKARYVIRVFDACRSAFGDTRGIMSPMTRGFQESLLKAGKGWASFSSCSSGEFAHESGELNHGVFTYYLCEGLEGKAADAEGNVTLDRLVDYVKTSVGNWSDQQRQKQTPHMQSDLSGVLVLTNTRPKKVFGSSSSGNPLQLLEVGIERHLAQTPQDARNLTFTDKKELESVAKSTVAVVHTIVDEFCNPSLSVSVSERKPLVELGIDFWQRLHHDINDQKIGPEFTQDTSGVLIDFASSEVVVPQTSLAICVARFSFFYWIWYYHGCHFQQLQGRFVASPQFNSSFFTFKPRAALDGLKVENSVKELFKRSCEDILIWGAQLKDFVNARLDPLRQIGTIVE